MTLNFWSGHLKTMAVLSPKFKIFGIRDRNRDRQPNSSGVDYSKIEIFLRLTLAAVWRVKEAK